MGNRQPEGPPPPPVVQRVRLRYAKRDRLRFTSHRDVARVVERAVRRARLPVAFSAGFSPHPRISWMGAAPTGVASEAEYVEIALSAWVEPADVARRLDAALPSGIDVLDAVEAGPGALADRLEASVWQLRIDGVDGGQLDDAVSAFLARSSVEVSRRTKDGTRPIDARAAVLALTRDGAPSTNPEPGRGACAILRLVVRHTTPVVRPDDVLAGLRAVTPLDLPTPPVATRLAQGPLPPDGTDGSDARVFDPLAPDRDAERVGAQGGTA